MKLVWLTDTHLNMLTTEERSKFYDAVIATDSDAVLITGDIAEAPSLIDVLMEIQAHCQQPIYFVLGNHDYYYSAVNTVKQQVTALTQSTGSLIWLPLSGPQVLKNDVILVGVDGWADGRCGNYMASAVTVNDSVMIHDLFERKIIGKYALLEKLQQLADNDAYQLQVHLKQAIHSHMPNKIIILTHVPPFPEACLRDGKVSSDDYLPFFASKATGDVLLEAATDNPTIEFLVLCGHTHTQAVYKPLDNLMVKVGGAKSGAPRVQEVVVL